MKGWKPGRGVIYQPRQSSCHRSMSQHFNSSRWPVILCPSQRESAGYYAHNISYTQPQSSPVLYGILFFQVCLVDLLILYLLLFVVLLGGQGRWGGLPAARGRAAHVLCAVELVDAARQQHAVAVQHHGALGTGLTG